ncbi:T9SS type A sorting domain-containing protein [Flavobacterium sp. 3HN19-14]|uniref:T9SS type A sorting domain-containing protein n=1 Tax=Flavobacterium sp. 3HN19-14 TaxID=3448133 RepID=UPI003EDFC591
MIFLLLCRIPGNPYLGNGSLGQLGSGNNNNNSDAYNSIACPSSLGVDDFAAAGEVIAYPNPLKNILNLSCNGKITTVAIYNLLGQEVIAKFLNSDEGTIDVSNLPSGTYFVKVAAENLVKTIKVIKE